MEPVKAAIIGLGWWGRKMTDLVQAKGDVIRFVRAADPNIAAAGDFAKSKGLPLSASYDEILADPAIEAVILATPHTVHGEQIAAAVKAKKHIFCEKPLSLDKKGAVESVRLVSEAGLVLGMGHERRFEPPIADLIRKAEDGTLGRLLQIESNFSHDKFLSLDPSNWRLNAEHAPAAGMTATGIHLTDLAVKLMGRATDVRVVCENLVSKFPQGDTLSAHIRFANGGTAYVSASLGMPFISRISVFGSKGWIDIRDKAHVEKPEGWVVTSVIGNGKIEVRELPPAEPVLDNLQSFARAVRGQAKYAITGEEMINNIALLETIVKAAHTGTVEKVP
jgi:predicted dehydrogenase